MKLNVELEWGEAIGDAMMKMHHLSRQLGINITSNINGVPIYVSPDDPAGVIKEIIEEYKKKN